MAVALLDLAAQVQEERAVGDVDDARALERVDRVAQGVPGGRAERVDRDVADEVARVGLDEVDRADRPAGAADGAGDLREHARAVGDLHAQDEAVLGGGRPGQRTASVSRGGAARARPPRTAARVPDVANEPDELFLIDGNSLAYRAFFALPESIATSTGFPTNAIFGFASMLVKILTEHGPRPTVVVWDAPGMSGRKEVYPEYKAQRTSRPDLLREQWPHLEPLVDAFGYRNVRVDGYEADDVIASIAERAREQGVPVTIVTGDRDAFQLIDPESRVRVMATSRGITDTKTYDYAAVVERYGIPPELIPDFYGLKGDTSDNIPGVPGIGDKTASQLLQTYGTLEEVLEHVDDISGAKRKENLREHAEDARISQGPGHDPARRPGRRRPPPRGRPRARPLAAARGLPRVRAARPAAAPGGGARVGRGGRARPRVRDDGRRARPRGDAAGRRGARRRATAGSRSPCRAPEVPEGELLAHEEGWRFARGRRRRTS